jgi:hypothetical protein
VLRETRRTGRVFVTSGHDDDTVRDKAQNGVGEINAEFGDGITGRGKEWTKHTANAFLAWDGQL